MTHGETTDTPLSITNANGTFYYHRDHQGSILSLTDRNGNEVEHFTYDNHYGRILEHTKTVETNNPYGYTGRVVDTKDLYYYRARYYDPTIQRFISEDPIGFASG
ncbi:RHS repeat-associated core domain-containing protein, partial [Nitratifractor sp.]|uniref:RHS repeat-associated core domain-containing protein n=1 Tax=Nitratifractor sp. TaxID=2268144 RepID=UPI0034153177